VFATIGVNLIKPPNEILCLIVPIRACFLLFVIAQKVTKTLATVNDFRENHGFKIRAQLMVFAVVYF
jgi:hypothetical protein